MKPAKLIIPLLGMTSINNPNLEQVKKAEISNQVLINEPSCFDLTANQEITE
jgi:hypothetical protein